MGDSLDNQDLSGGDAQQNVAVVEFGAFANYLRKAATILLPEDDAHLVPPALNVALEDKSNQDCIRKFLSDSQVQALYIQRTCIKGNNLSMEKFFWEEIPFEWYFIHFTVRNYDVINIILACEHGCVCLCILHSNVICVVFVLIFAGSIHLGTKVDI